VSLLPRALVDALPERWWAVGNLHFFAGPSMTWHFCVMAGYAEHSVRTVVAFGTPVAWGATRSTLLPASAMEPCSRNDRRRGTRNGRCP